MKLGRSKRISTKLLLVVVVTTLAVQLFSAATLVFYDIRQYERERIEDVSTQADILGLAATPALIFNDPGVAGDALSVLRARPKIIVAAVYTPSGTLFATYPAEAVESVPALPDKDGHRVAGDEIVLFKRIVDRNQIIGTIYLRARYELTSRVTSHLSVLAIVMVASLGLAIGLAAWLNRAVTRPISAISDTARKITSTRDFALRAHKTTDDEIGDLVDGFNSMLGEIDRRARELQASNDSLAREVSERRTAEEALLLSEQRNRTLVSAVNTVVWNADSQLNFVADQPSWQAYTGQKRDDYAGKGWRYAVHADDRPALDATCAAANEHPQMFEHELRLWNVVSGGYRVVVMRAVPVLREEGGVREWIGTIEDIDDRLRAKNELQRLNEELEQRVARRTAELEAANKEMETFSYSVSHDLRAPVRAVAGFSRLLREDHGPMLDAEALRKLGIIEDEATRMGQLIDDLLAFSRLGRKSMEPMPLDMQAMARNVFDRLQLQGGGNPAATLRIGELPPAFGDRALMEQVWANLLSNALKYSAKRESPMIEVGAVSDEDELIYFVRDNGAGFDPRYKAKLFGVFQRLHDAAEFGGTGVGLALVQRIVLRHHGRVWADGKPDHGATFYFALPREAEHAAG